MSLLDTALLEANIDSEKKVAYYNLFLNSEIFIPTLDNPKEEFKRVVEEKQIFKPIITESEGKKYLMLFDSQDKMSAWVKKDIGFVALQGRVLFDIFQDSSLTWMLNFGTDHVKVFSPEEIQQVRNFLNLESTNTVSIQKGTSLGIGTLEHVPLGIHDALKQIGKLKDCIFSIYVGSIIFLEQNDKPHFAIVVKAVESIKDTKEDIIAAVGRAINRCIPKGECYDIFFDDGDDITKDIIRKGKLVYQKDGV